MVSAGDFNQTVDRWWCRGKNCAAAACSPAHTWTEPTWPHLCLEPDVQCRSYCQLNRQGWPQSDLCICWCQLMLANKSMSVKTFRTISPKQHAQFPAYISTLNLDHVGSNSTPADTQQDFDAFYDVALQLLERFYPQHLGLITITSRDPYYITAAIKAKLRRKNWLTRAGSTEDASALAQRIGKYIVRRNTTRLSHIRPRQVLWAAVRQLTGRKQSS